MKLLIHVHKNGWNRPHFRKFNADIAGVVNPPLRRAEP